VANFSSYDKTYGTLGGVVVFLLWMWITNMAILLGAELNAETERAEQIHRGVRDAEDRLQVEERTPS
jgi:membrane protein